MRIWSHKSRTAAYANRTSTGLQLHVLMRRIIESFLKAIEHKVFRNFDQLIKSAFLPDLTGACSHNTLFLAKWFKKPHTLLTPQTALYTHLLKSNLVATNAPLKITSYLLPTHYPGKEQPQTCVAFVLLVWLHWTIKQNTSWAASMLRFYFFH